MDKPYVKAIYNGDILEFYIMTRQPFAFEKKSEKDKSDRPDLDWIYNQMENRKESRRNQTLRDARNTMRRLAVRNFKPLNSLFITLTYRYHINDIEQADGHYRAFVKAIREESEQPFNYIAVREFTKQGRIHYHLLTDFKIDGDLEDPEEVDLKRWERDVAKVWQHGFVDIKLVNHVDNVGAYLSKYMSKGIGSELFLGRKYYLCSQGLERPEVIVGETAWELYNAMNKKNEVFTNSYESEYLGQITYVEYNLNRQNKNLKLIN